MPLDSNSMERNIGSEFARTWVLPATLRQLEECGETDLVAELIAIFQTDTASRLEILAQAVETADYTTARQEAHTIKGSALQVGADSLAELCRQMEVEARKPQPEGLIPLFREMLRSFDEICGLIAAGRGPANGSRHYGE